MVSLVPRDLYAALERCTYLNQASLGLIPGPAVGAMHAFIDRTAQHGNLWLSDPEEARILDGVRSAAAELLGTTADAVAVVRGASEVAWDRSRRCSRETTAPSSWFRPTSRA